LNNRDGRQKPRKLFGEGGIVASGIGERRQLPANHVVERALRAEAPA